MHIVCLRVDLSGSECVQCTIVGWQMRGASMSYIWWRQKDLVIFFLLGIGLVMFEDAWFIGYWRCCLRGKLRFILFILLRKGVSISNDCFGGSACGSESYPNANPINGRQNCHSMLSPVGSRSITFSIIKYWSILGIGIGESCAVRTPLSESAS